MGSSTFTRQYVMLRPVGCQGSGFARVEVSHGKGRIVLHGAALPPGSGLRALLVSGQGEGCVLDLGAAQASPTGCIDLHKDHLPLPMLRGYDAVVITSDWPAGDILLTGSLARPPRCTLWQMQEAVRQYLRLPCDDMSSPPPLPQPEEEPEEPELLAQLIEARDALPSDSLLRLREIRWPEKVEGLRAYFEALPPCAPFDAPGWRFVRAPLEQGSPAEYGVVGRHVSAHRVDRVAYALPGMADVLPPGGLQGYSWQRGRDGQGYWLNIERI